MIEKNEIEKVWYIEGNNLKHKNKVVSKVMYEGKEFAILKSQRGYTFSDMLIKDEDGVYWSLGIAPIKFEKFVNVNIENSIPEVKEYCDRLKEIYENLNLKDFFEKKINNNKYFNKCELKYISKQYPDILEKSKKSRENYLEQNRKEKEREKNRVRRVNEQKVKTVNGRFEEKLKLIKLKIITKQSVKSEDLEFYKDSKYENGITSQNCFLYLAKQYGINIPIATQGFINNRLVNYDFSTGFFSYKVTKNKRPSIQMCQYLDQLYTKVKEEFKQDKLQLKECVNMEKGR